MAQKRPLIWEVGYTRTDPEVLSGYHECAAKVPLLTWTRLDMLNGEGLLDAHALMGFTIDTGCWIGESIAWRVI
jgi:hypothetical protein